MEDCEGGEEVTMIRMEGYEEWNGGYEGLMRGLKRKLKFTKNRMEVFEGGKEMKRSRMEVTRKQ